MLLDKRIITNIVKVIHNDNRGGIDLLGLMATCRAAYQAGIPYLLKGPVNLRGTPKHISSFHSFMGHDINYRAPLIHTMRLCYPFEWGSKSGSVENSMLLRDFSQTLKQCHNLRRLEIFGNEAWFYLNREFYCTLISLENLTSLLLDDPQANVVPHKTYLATPSFVDSAGYGQEVNKPAPLVWGALEIGRNIEVLHLERLEFGKDSSKAIFPRVHTLSVGERRCGDIHPFITHFPKLRALILQPTQPHGRSRIMELRSRFPNINIQKTVCWDSLDYFAGTLRDLYALSPQCHIRHISTIVSKASDLHIPLIWPITLQVVRPLHLTVQLHLAGWKVDELPDVVPPEVGLEVTHVNLTIVFGNSEITLADLEVSCFKFVSQL